jgi:hypothetical protein
VTFVPYITQSALGIIVLKGDIQWHG